METAEEIRGATVVSLAPHYDSLDEGGSRRLELFLKELIPRVAPQRLVLDMTLTERIGSTFIATLFGAVKKCRAQGGELILCSPSPFCAEVLRVVRSDQLFRVFPTRDQAIDAATGKPSNG